jgi:hypothetical protein
MFSKIMQFLTLLATVLKISSKNYKTLIFLHKIGKISQNLIRNQFLIKTNFGQKIII